MFVPGRHPRVVTQIVIREYNFERLQHIIGVIHTEDIILKYLYVTPLKLYNKSCMSRLG